MALPPLALPPVPWQLTGNHWLSLPCIHPADGSVHAVGVLHRGARATIEFAGGDEFVQGSGRALLRPVVTVDGQRQEISGQQFVWERALGWLPAFSCALGSVVVRGTVFAPYGRDADVPGAVYALSVENRGPAARSVEVALDGYFGHRQLRVRTARSGGEALRVRVSGDVVVLEGGAATDDVALAIAGDAGTDVAGGGGETKRFSLRRTMRVEPGAREQGAFYIAAGPERDGAEATVDVLRRRGWRALIEDTRDALQSLEQTTGGEAMDRLINRNLLFAYFFAVGRALDDAHYYLVRTRVPWHGRGVTVRDWEALTWTIPAVQLIDPPLARELILRVCEVHGYAPGRGVHYLDGTLFEPGFTIEGVAAYAIAADRYIRDSGDDQIVEEPVLADTLYLTSEDIAARRDDNVPLYRSEVTLSGAALTYPFTLHGNAVVAQALDILRRTLDEETARGVQDPEAVRAAIRRHFSLDPAASAGSSSRATLATAVDLAGGHSTDDDPVASTFWLPLYDAVSRQDSIYRRTVKSLPAEARELARECARLLGPDARAVLQWLRRAPLDNGFAAELVNADGRAVGNGGDASLSGLLAWSAWYAVHALGERP